MDKLLTFPTSTEKGIFLYAVGEGRDQGYLEKTASSQLHPQIADYVSSAQKIPGKVQLLLTALGAGEFWGSNVNGDFFTEEGLKNPTSQFGYKTFEQFAKVYKHHVNKDPAKSYGDVALSVWNDKMKRVELIILLDEAKAPDLVDRLNNGEYPEVSMGTRVPYDVCSCCGNRAKTRVQYCDHLRYHMNKIPPGFGKKAYAINTIPRFFDISFVLIGADRIASVTMKVAGVQSHSAVSSTQLAEKHSQFTEKVASFGMEKVAYGLNKVKVAAKKEAEIIKDVKSNIKPEVIENLDNIGSRGAEALRPLEPNIPKKTIIRITAGTKGTDLLNRIMTTFSMMNMIPKQDEFQSIALRSLGHSDLADKYERAGLLFDPDARLSSRQQKVCCDCMNFRPGNFDPNVFQLLKPMMPDRSYSAPLLEKRVIRLVKLAEEGKLEYPTTEHVKIAEDDDRTPVSALTMMLSLAGVWQVMKKKLPMAAAENTSLFSKMPTGLATALGLGLGVGTIAAFNSMNQRTVMGKYDFNPDKGPIHNPNQTWQDRINEKNNDPLTKTALSKADYFSAGKRIMIGAPLLYMAHGIQTVKKARNPHTEEGFAGKMIRKYPDLLTTALVGEAIMGRPITRRLKNIFNLKKTASLPEIMKDTAVFSAAFPGASLPARLATNFIEHGIIAGVEKLLSKKKRSERRPHGKY